ncbi:hypothetical protein BDV19DRAFT_356959 [Aspergillus venezuelensis]
MYVCSDSRTHGLRHYQQAFRLPNTTGREYISLSYTIDRISIWQTYFRSIPDCEKSLIQSLMFARENEEYFCRCEGLKLREFDIVREIRVIYLDNVDTWDDAYQCA